MAARGTAKADSLHANDNFSIGAGNLRWIKPAIPDMTHEEVNTQASPLNDLAKQICESEAFVERSCAKFSSIYIVSDIYGDYSKIGVATKPTKRLAQLQTGNPSRLFIHRLFWIYCGRRNVTEIMLAIEAASHASAGRRHQRCIGEWFKCSPSEACDVVLSEVEAFAERDEVSRFSLLTPPRDLWRA